MPGTERAGEGGLDTAEPLRRQYRFEVEAVGLPPIAHAVDVYVPWSGLAGLGVGGPCLAARALVISSPWFALRPGETDPGALRVLWLLPPPQDAEALPPEWDAAVLAAVRAFRES